MTLHGTYDHQLMPRRRLDRLLPAVGRRGAAPVDARARASRRRTRERALDAAAPGAAGRRVAHRARRRGRRRRPRGDVDLLVIIGASVVLFGLVVVRMAGLVRQQERSAARERTLSRAGAALVAATTPRADPRAALSAARSLAGHGSAALLCIARGGRRAGRRPPTGAPRPRLVLDAGAGDRRRAAGRVPRSRRSPLGRECARTCCCRPSTTRARPRRRLRGEVRGLLVVDARRRRGSRQLAERAATRWRPRSRSRSRAPR